MLGKGVPGNFHGIYLVAANHTHMLFSVLPNLVGGIIKMHVTSLCEVNTCNSIFSLNRIQNCLALYCVGNYIVEYSLIGSANVDILHYLLLNVKAYVDSYLIVSNAP